MRYVLTFVSLIKDIKFILNIQRETLAKLCSIFENKVTVHKDNQGMIELAVSQQMRLCTKHIIIKYHHFRSFVINGDV